MDRGGDPTTDHASLVLVGVTETERAAICPPYRPGRLASATALTLPVSPAQYPVSVDFSVSRTPDAEDSDGLPTLRESRDGLPSTTVFQGSELAGGSSLIDRCLERRFTDSESIGVSRDSRNTEKSEHLRQSQPGQVQNLPTRAERSSHGCSLGGSTGVQEG